MTTPEATVVIPTLDGERYLDRVLAAVEGQEFAGGVEILVIDSGSTDRTLEIVAAHPGVRLHRIPNVEFGHGRTRDLGARMAMGRHVAYLTQDAIPAGPDWLARLIAPLADGLAAAVTGRQIPRPGCVPLMKYDIIDTFRAQGPDDGVTVVTLPRGATPADLDRLSFYSDVNAASTRELLTGRIPYRDVPYSEDYAFARDVLEAGLAKAYAGDAAVIHSNDLGVRAYADRMAEETTALLDTGIAVPRHGPLGSAARVLWGILRDARRILTDPDYGPAERVRWTVVNPAFHLARRRGVVRALRGRAPARR